MIVKDEAHGIARTLRSARPFVDRWWIVDTGSTDGTPEIVQAELGDLPGVCFRTRFEDFASTRNLLLSLATGQVAGEPSDFLLLLDADDILEGGEALRAFLQNERDKSDYCAAGTRPDAPHKRSGGCVECSARDALFLRMSEGSCEWSSTRVVRSSAVGPDDWHYTGAVHEVLVHPSGRQPTITIPGASIRHEPPPKSLEARRARLERDVEALRPVAEKGDARAVFYLARTLRMLGRTEEAREAFNARIVLGGWCEEVFEALLERAHLSGDSVSWWLKAHAHSPHRAEPLVALAEHFRALDQHGPALTFALRASQLPRPQEGLFVDRDCYTWKAHALVSISAWYVGELLIGEEATRRALAAGPPPEWRAALEGNLVHYEGRAGEWCETKERARKAAFEAEFPPETRAALEAQFEEIVKRMSVPLLRKEGE